MTRKEEIIQVLINLGGEGSLKEIVEGVKSITKLGVPRTLDAGIRCVLERHSSDSYSYLGKEDLFYSVEGIGGGIWGLRRINESRNHKRY